MDDNNLIDQFIAKLVEEIMDSPSFASLPEEQKQAKKTEITNYFDQRIIDVMLDEMSEEQLEAIKDLDFTSPEMEAKLEEISAQIPGFAFTLEEDFQKQAGIIKETGNLPEETQSPAIS